MLKLFKKKAKAAPEGETEAAAAPAEEGAEGEAPKKKKPPLLLIIGAAVLVLGGGGGGAAFFLLKPKPAEAHGEEAAAGDHGGGGGGHDTKKKKKGGGGHGEASGGEAPPGAGEIREGPDGVTFYTLPDMVVNIQTNEGRPALLKLKLTLEMHDVALAEHLQAEGPRLQDMFQSFLRELLRPDDLAGSAGSYALRQEILHRVNLIAAPGRVDAVLIEEMLVQ